MSFVFDFMSVYSFHITFSLAVLQFQNHRLDFAGREGAQRRSRGVSLEFGRRAAQGPGVSGAHVRCVCSRAPPSSTREPAPLSKGVSAEAT